MYIRNTYIFNYIYIFIAFYSLYMVVYIWGCTNKSLQSKLWWCCCSNYITYWIFRIYKQKQPNKDNFYLFYIFMSFSSFTAFFSHFVSFFLFIWIVDVIVLRYDNIYIEFRMNFSCHFSCDIAEREWKIKQLGKHL